MRFAIIALAVASAAAALPQNNGCCCCDISRNVISCDAAILASECVCAEVVCPKGAPTVYTGIQATPPAQAPDTGYTSPTEAAAILRSDEAAPGPFDDACCCCDIRRDVIGCTRTIKKNECICPMVACPAGAATVLDDPPAATHAA